MGDALNDQGKIEEAIQALNKAISIKPDYAEAHNTWVMLSMLKGNLTKQLRAIAKLF